MQTTLALVCSAPEENLAAGKIVAYAFDEAGGTFAPLAETAHGDNPTFLVIDAPRRRVFVAGETKASIVSSYRLDPMSGRLALVNAQPTHGQYACHVAVDASGRTVFATNYSDNVRNPASQGALAYRVGDDGALAPAFWRVAFEGDGPVKDRQGATHPHSTLLSPDQRRLLVPDLGVDGLHCFAFDPASGSIAPGTPPFVPLPPGSGPRHAIFSADGRYLYVVDELASAVTTIDVAGGMRVADTVSTLPADFTAYNICADIHLTGDGGLLFVSNRGHNSLAAFAVDRASGRLMPRGQTATGGDWPRNFAIDPSGKFVTVANQKSGEIVVFALDAATGRLREAAPRLTVAQPMCIKFARFEM